MPRAVLSSFLDSGYPAILFFFHTIPHFSPFTHVVFVFLLSLLGVEQFCLAFSIGHASVFPTSM